MTVGELKIKLSADTSDFDKGIGLAKQALENMESKSNITVANVSTMAQEIAENIKGASPQMADAGRSLFGAIDDEVPNITEEILSSAEYIMENIISVLGGYTNQMTGVGVDLVQGIGVGISASTDYLMTKIQILGQSVLSEIESVFEIASPSKKTAYLGQMLGEGLASGLAESLRKVQISAGGMYPADGVSAQSNSNTYNTYNSTYNGARATAESVGMADFENRIRRAYG